MSDPSGNFEFMGKGHGSKLPCIVEDCPFTRATHGYCGKHLYRFRRYGDPLKLGVRPRNTGAQAAHWKGDNITYRGAHARCNNTRGRPSLCEVCGTTEAAGRFEWALKHDAPTIKVDADGRSYSVDPNDYVRMCSACHVQYDKAGVPRDFRTTDRRASL